MIAAPFDYLMQVSICMMVCSLIYTSVFKRLTFFSLNRFFLLFAITACLVVPALHITLHLQAPVKLVQQQIATFKDVQIEKVTTHATGPQQATVNWLLVASVGYAMVCMALLCRLLFSIFKIALKAKHVGVKSGADYIISEPNGANASFFNIIFICGQSDDPLETEQILAHEREHARLYHSADKLYLQIVKAFFWFNPFIYLMYRDLNEVHEFQVDDSLKRTFNPQTYATLLLKLSSLPKLSFANQFSALALKSRIKMMFGVRTLATKRWLYFLLLPMVGTMLYSFSVERVYANAPLKKELVLVLDAGHGGKENGAVGVDGRREKDMALLMVKQIKMAADKRGIHTILTRTDDSYIDIHNRLDNKADAFVSIHLNGSSLGLKESKHGMSILVSQNSPSPLSKNLAVNVKTSLEQLKGNNPNEVELDVTRQRLFTLNKNQDPAIIIELGYITSKNDVNYLLNNQHQIAEKIVDAVIASNTK